MQVEQGRAQATPTDRAHSVNGSDRQQIGGRIKSARQNASLTQRALAKKLGVSAGAVGQWETGGVPAIDRLATLAHLLGVSLDWLLGKCPQVNKPAATDLEVEAGLQLIREARQLGVDLHKVVAEARQRRWIDENRDALADSNAFLARHGLWSDGKRQF